MAVCIPDGLLDEGRCFQCSTEQQFWMMALQLLCDIGASSGGGGIQRVFHFPSDPNGSVVAPDPAIGYGDDGSLWAKYNGVTDDQGWFPIISASMPESNRVADAPVQVVLATNRLDPELVFSPTLSSLFVKNPEPSAAVKKNADSFLKKMGNWFASNLWFWIVILVLAVLTDSAKGQAPPIVRNIITTNAPVTGFGGISIFRVGLGVGISNSTSSGSSTGGTNLGTGSPVFVTNGPNALAFRTLTAHMTNSAPSPIITTNTDGTLNIAILTNAPGSGSGGSGDIVANLVSNEVSIVGATVLTSSAYGTMHVITGTSNYTITLPAVAGNAGRSIGFRVDVSFGNLVTLSNSSLINGLSSRSMWAQESAIILCNGSTYTKIAGKSVPMSARIARTNDFSVPPTVGTIIPVNQITYANPASFVNISSNSLVPPRPSVYQFLSIIIFDNVPNPGNNISSILLRNGVNQLDFDGREAVVGGYPNPHSIAFVSTALGDYFQLMGYQNSISNYNLYIPEGVNSITAVEVPQW